MDKVQIVDVWLFPKNGSATFYKIIADTGEVVEQEHWDCVADAPIMVFNDTPENPMRFHAQFFDVPAAELDG